MNPDIFILSNPKYNLSKQNEYILTSLFDNTTILLSEYLNNLNIHISEFLNTKGTKEIGICSANEFIEKIPSLFQQNIDLHCFFVENKILYPLIPDISHFSLLLSLFRIQYPENLESEINDVLVLFNTKFLHMETLKITITKNEFNIQFNQLTSNTFKSFLKIAIYLSTAYNITTFIIDRTIQNGYDSKKFDSLNEVFSYLSSLI